MNTSTRSLPGLDPEEEDYLALDVDELIDQMESLWRIDGALGVVGDYVNGFYEQQPVQAGKKPIFYRVTVNKDSDPMSLWYYTDRKCWMISDRTQIGTDNARAMNKSNAAHPQDISGPWYVFNAELQRFQKNAMFLFSLCTPQEMSENIPQYLIIEGRIGYNRAMNGYYKRGDHKHEGKYYWKNLENDFKIRWFESKWVIDWRKGLRKDNIGGAVVKEDTPEPWMCCIPWRVYDAKAKGRKWKYDKNVGVRLLKNEAEYDQVAIKEEASKNKKLGTKALGGKQPVETR